MTKYIYSSTLCRGSRGTGSLPLLRRALQSWAIPVLIAAFIAAAGSVVLTLRSQDPVWGLEGLRRGKRGRWGIMEKLLVTKTRSPKASVGNSAITIVSDVWKCVCVCLKVHCVVFKGRISYVMLCLNQCIRSVVFFISTGVGPQSPPCFTFLQ